VPNFVPHPAQNFPAEIIHGTAFRFHSDVRVPFHHGARDMSHEGHDCRSWKFFLGARFIAGTSFITVRPTSCETPPIPPDVGLQTNLRALGVTLVRDSRPNRFYPVKGSVVDFTSDFFAEALGSKYSFQSYNFTFNKYVSPLAAVSWVQAIQSMYSSGIAAECPRARFNCEPGLPGSAISAWGDSFSRASLPIWLYFFVVYRALLWDRSSC
jgi:hypothetical protein